MSETYSYDGVFTDDFLADRREDFRGQIASFSYAAEDGESGEASLDTSYVSGEYICFKVTIPKTGTAKTVTSLTAYDGDGEAIGTVSGLSLSVNASQTMLVILRVRYAETESDS